MAFSVNPQAAAASDLSLDERYSSRNTTAFVHLHGVVSRGSLQEPHYKSDSGHRQWFWHVADRSNIYVQNGGLTTESELPAVQIDELWVGNT
jgi:hypothetical protein